LHFGFSFFFVFPDKVPLKINRGRFGPNKRSQCVRTESSRPCKPQSFTGSASTSQVSSNRALLP